MSCLIALASLLWLKWILHKLRRTKFIWVKTEQTQK
jgi:hypothetical protein